MAYEDVGREVRRSRGVCVDLGTAGRRRPRRRGGALGARSVIELRAERGDDEREFETVKCARFNASGETVMTVDEFNARVETADGGFASSSKTSTRSDASRSDIIGGMNTRQDGASNGTWDPHERESFACGVDADVVVFDHRRPAAPIAGSAARASPTDPRRAIQPRTSRTR